MNQKWLFSGVCSLFAVLGFFMLGCPTDRGDHDDTWTKVTNLNEIKGTWEGSSSVMMPEMPLAPFLEMMGEDNAEIAAYEAFLPESLRQAPLDYAIVMTVTDSSYEEKVVINCKSYLETVLKDTMLSGYESMIWALLKTELAPYFLENGIFEPGPLSDGISSYELTDNYEIIAEGGGPMPEDPSISDDGGFSLYINQDKTKLKLIIEASDADGAEIPEIILTKK
ncbi:MAG: hypothetical protein LBG95_08595 [Treponema sp.]|jgi:hypothetical protein|nr:hypothetical protein [Treponema sp.]